MSENTNNLQYSDSKFHIEKAVLDKVEGAVDSSTGEKTITLDSNLKVLGSLDISGATYSLCQSPEWIKVLVDSQERIIAGVRTDGSVYIGELEIPASLQSVINTLTAENVSLDERLQALESIISVTENPEFIQVTTDSEDKILEGITTDGVKKVNIPVDNGAAIIESIDNLEFIEAKVDAEGRLIEGINKNGEKIFGVIPPQIKQYIDDNMPTGGSGVQSIEYEDATGDMYATYDDESGVTDVYMEPNGDIYVESEE